MRDLLPQLFKWAGSILFVILGFKLMNMAMAGQTWALMAGLLSLGLVYWQYNGRDDIPKQILLVTILVVGAAALAASYLPSFSFFPFNQGFFLSWAGWSMLFGLPAVGWAFQKYG